MQAIDDPGMSEWGNPSRAIGLLSSEFIAAKSERGEVNHLSTPRKRKQSVIPLVVASERGTA
jgi:hypothetical protein